MGMFDEPTDAVDPLVGQTVDAFIQTREQAAAPKTQTAAFRNQEDAPACPNCGSITIRAGSCYSCVNCGASTGCG
jgi:ribonucleoside-diphosphate reductase alpha chain